MSSLYDCNAVDDLIDKYIKKGGEVVTVEEGVLGYGLTILVGEGLKTVVINEVYLNEWSSAHTIRMYNKCPKKYQEMLEKVYMIEVILEQLIENLEHSYTYASLKKLQKSEKYLQDVLDEIEKIALNLDCEITRQDQEELIDRFFNQ